MASTFDLTRSDDINEIFESISDAGSDSDFLSQPIITVATPNKRKQHDPDSGQINDSNKKFKSDGPLMETCGICSEDWTSTGSHQISSIVCGHLFGKSCLEKILQEKATVSRHLIQAACPICNTLFKKKEIHPVWTKRTKNLNPSEIEEASKYIKENTLEIDSLTSELKDLKVLHLNGESELERLRKELTDIKKKLATFENPGLESFDTDDPKYMNAAANQIQKMIYSKKLPKKPLFEFNNSIEIGTPENCSQVFAYHPENQIVLASKRISSDTYGLVTFNLRNNNFQRVYPVHSGPIRDIVVFNFNDEIRALSVGMDRTLVLSSPLSLTILASYSLPTPGWSCCHNSSQPHILYVGSTAGQVIEFDTSVSNCNSPSRIFSYPNTTMRSPVHSLYYLEKHNTLLGANLDGVYIWAINSEPDQDMFCYKISGNAFADLQCYSLAYDSHIDNFVTSFRHPKTRATYHQICSLNYKHSTSIVKGQHKILEARIKFAIDSPFPENALPKTALFSPINLNLNLFSQTQHTFLCIREEKNQETLLWDLTVSTTQPYRLKLNSDEGLGCPLAYIFCQSSKLYPHKHLLVLTNTRVLIFQFNAP